MCRTTVKVGSRDEAKPLEFPRFAKAYTRDPPDSGEEA